MDDNLARIIINSMGGRKSKNETLGTDLRIESYGTAPIETQNDMAIQAEFSSTCKTSDRDFRQNLLLFANTSLRENHQSQMPSHFAQSRLSVGSTHRTGHRSGQRNEHRNGLRDGP